MYQKDMTDFPLSLHINIAVYTEHKLKTLFSNSQDHCRLSICQYFISI